MKINWTSWTAGMNGGAAIKLINLIILDVLSEIGSY
jgi:hypothetical protein